jgi:hypothetical protein
MQRIQGTDRENRGSGECQPQRPGLAGQALRVPVRWRESR